jgi:hypothetical protein
MHRPHLHQAGDRASCAGRPVTVAPSVSWWLRGSDWSCQGPLIVEPLLVAGPDLEFATCEVSRIGDLCWAGLC